MKSSTAIILAIVGGLLLICICGALASVSLLLPVGHVVAQNVDVEDRPVDVAQVAARIADFDLPAGYRPQAAVNLFGMALVVYGPHEEYGHIDTNLFGMPRLGVYGPHEEHGYIVLLQEPVSYAGDRADLVALTRRVLEEQNDGEYWDVRTVGYQEVTIRGEQVMLTIGEGINHSGNAYRQVTGVFEGKGGPTLLVVTQPASSWDQEMVDEFIASIR